MSVFPCLAFTAQLYLGHCFLLIAVSMYILETERTTVYKCHSECSLFCAHKATELPQRQFHVTNRKDCCHEVRTSNLSFKFHLYFPYQF